MAKTDGSVSDRCGVLFVATGKDYFDLACDAAQSVRETNPTIEIDLFTDCNNARQTALFEQIHTIQLPHSRSKLECMPRSRFHRTLFLDCDTRVIADLGDLFDLLDRFDLAMAHDVRRNSDLIKQGWREKTPYSFPQLNSGVVLYKKNHGTDRFFADWADLYQRSATDRDQVVLKDLIWNTDLRFYVLPPEFNLRRVTVLDAWEPLDAVPTIIHSHIFLQHLRHPGSRKVTEIRDLIEIERENLKKEWHRIGISDPDLKWR